MWCSVILCWQPVAQPSQQSRPEILSLGTRSQASTRWKPRTRMYSRSWTTSADLCNRKTNLFLHASCAHIVSAKAPEQQFTKRQLTSTTTSPPAQRNHHQHSNITSAMKSRRNHQRNEITSATNSPEQTKSPAQRKHQHNEITSEQH